MTNNEKTACRSIQNWSKRRNQTIKDNKDNFKKYNLTKYFQTLNSNIEMYYQICKLKLNIANYSKEFQYVLTNLVFCDQSYVFKVR